MPQRLIFVFILGFYSGLPLNLVTSTLQAWYAQQGVSVQTVGLLSLIGLPYILRVIWSPLVDSIALNTQGLRKSWIVTTQTALCCGLVLLSVMNPLDYPVFMAIAAFILAVFAATQDVAIDAHRIEYLPRRWHGMGASLAVVGYRAAMILTGGLCLISAAFYGWRTTYMLMAGVMFCGILATCISREPKKNRKLIPWGQAFKEPIVELVKRPKIFALLGLIISFKLAEAFTSSSSGIVIPFFIQGLGLPLDQIGYVNKIMGVLATVSGGLFAGLLLYRVTLFNALLFFGLCQAVTNVLFVALAYIGKNFSLFAAAVTLDNFAAGMGMTALLTLFMRTVHPQFVGTQFSLLVALALIPTVISGPLGAVLFSNFGWIGLYCISFGLAFLYLPFLLILRYDIKPQKSGLDSVFI